MSSKRKVCQRTLISVLRVALDMEIFLSVRKMRIIDINWPLEMLPHSLKASSMMSCLTRICRKICARFGLVGI